MIRCAKVTPFRLSRIHAQGWNAGRNAWAGDAPANPYTTEPERSRWQAGFSNAQTDPRRTPR
jgi:ribosome modulation factor